jgi:hypothetical protein
MKAFPCHRLSPVLGALSVALAATGCVIVERPPLSERTERVFPVSGKPQVTVSNDCGAIEIRTWERPDVRVVIEKNARDIPGLADIDVRAEQNGSEILVAISRVITFQHFWGFWSPDGDLLTHVRVIVSTPASSYVNAQSRGGSIDIERIAGGVDAQSRSGRIRGRSMTGDLIAHTRSGSIDLEGIDGVMVAVTRSGSIRGRDLMGTLNASTRSGSITLEGMQGAIVAETGGGSITASGRLTAVDVQSRSGRVTIEAASGSGPTSDWNIATQSGSVSLEIPVGFSAELDALTRSGHVGLYNGTMLNVTHWVSKNAVRGRFGAGGRMVLLRTRSGRITVRAS